MRKLLLLSWACLSATLLIAQSRTITGKVTNKQTGVALPAVTVSVRGSSTATQTNENGTFTLVVPSNTKALVFSSVGYIRTEVAIGQNNSIDVGLEQGEGEKLDEVVVVAYGTQTKKETTGAMAKVGAVDIENKPFTSVDKILQGAVAGLQSISPSGQPGSIQQVRIRGIGSISASSAPLWVIDGIPVNSGDLSRNTTTSNALAGLNPNDIESVTVLKDASATSLYGSRAANGVILVNTKKGRPGKTKLRFDAEVGFNEQAKFPSTAEPLNRDEYFSLLEEGLVNAGATPAQVVSISNGLGKSNGFNDDWFDLVTRTGVQQQYNLSASGGTDKTTFFVSGGYFKQEASVIASDFTRYSSNFNIGHKVSEKLNFGLQANISYSHQHTPSQAGAFANPVLASLFLRPSQNAYNADGTVNTSNATFNQTFNPIALEQLDDRSLKTVKGLGSVNLEYKILPDLKFSSRYGIDYNDLEENQYQNPVHGDGRTVNGRGIAFLTRAFNWIWTNQLDYRRYLNADQDIYVEAKLGYESQKSQTYNISTFGENFPATTTLTLPIVASSPKQSSAFNNEYSFTSTFSALNLNFRDKYILTGTFRSDGSSRFGGNNRYGNFWSVGGAWNIDAENFMSGVGAISFLKLRASYGINGNASGIGDYASLYTYTFGGGNNYNNQPGGTPGNPGNENLTWEKNKAGNIGVDAGFFGDRLSLTLDVYRRVTSDLLLNEPVSRTTGFTTVTRNIGSMENKGVEVTINAVPVRGDLRWDISLNTAFNKNEITKLNGDINSDPFIRKEGYDYQSYFMRSWAGVDPANGNALWYIDDTRKTTTSNVNQATRFIVGKSATPKTFGGLTNTISWRGLVLEAQLYYTFGSYLYDNWGFITYGDGAFPQLNKEKRQLDRWKNPGDITNVPKYIYNNQSSSNVVSDRYLFKGDYIRLTNLTLGYDFSKSLIQRLKVTSLRFYVRGTNLWTFISDDNLPFDPEQGVTGTNDLQIPIVKTVSLGINVGF